jgi:dTDP-4-amino-4,6-dideoxygalactose transaminase
MLRFDPARLILALEKENIESRPVWKPMHMQPVFKDYHFFTNSESICIGKEFFKRGVCLPSGSSLDKSDQEVVLKILESLFVRNDKN